MVGSMFAAVAGLKTHQNRMDVISNNIANINTWGYKAQSANFTDTLYHTQKNGQSSGDAAVGELGGINTSQIGYGVDIGSISVNYTTGSRSLTGRANELMIDGPAFFIVGTWPGGDFGTPTPIAGSQQNNNGQFDLAEGTGLSLSRVGILGKDGNGYLTDDSGYYIYGYAANADRETINYGGGLVPIRAQYQENGEWRNYASVTFQQDGTITGVRQDGSESEVIGQLAVANVGNTNGLEKAGGYYYTIGPNAGTVTVMQTNNATGNILSGYLEMSNTNLADEMANMIITQRGYQANTKMITVTDEMLQELVNMKR